MQIAHTCWARFLYRSYLYLLSQAASPLLRIEQHYRIPKGPPNDRIIEYTFALQALLTQTNNVRKVLDVGAGDSSWPHLLWYSGLNVKAIDKIVDYEQFPVRNRHFRVQQDDITRTVTSSEKENYSIITCISTLEHIEAFDLAMEGIFQRLNQGGILILTIPWGQSYVSNLVSFLGSDSQFSKAAQTGGHLTQLFCAHQLEGWLKLGWELVLREDWQLFAGCNYMQGQRLSVPIRLSSCTHPDNYEGSHGTQLSCFVFQKKLSQNVHI